MRTTFEIIFNENIDHQYYPEASLFSKNSIIVDADSRHAIPKGKEQIALQIKGEFKTYSNVFSVCPYVYDEG